ncbi:outer membrane protein with beta-barrel domain [Mucilaginibacter frigoritolerans]|uniref:Outer membrane protein with beta-barrel domain n=2 Tax=Mucilaginibacter frigoritolerans TaxID=652788 RepID=A0A562TNE8_9SPHI|nr:outer membrane protein with beta-barrel domain [Mucilaginibacter frigoritolerans]
MHNKKKNFMKKLILAALLLVSIKSFSQTTTPSTGDQGILSRLEFGIKAGSNVSNFDKFNLPTDPLIGFNAGATVAFKFTDHFMVQEDFLYSQEGAKVKGGILGDQDIKLSYVQVPILLKYRTTSGFYVEAGAQTGILLKYDVAGYTSDQKVFKKINASAVGGIGYQSKMGLGIGARYAYGLTQVGNFPTSAAVNNNFKNETIQANIFYVF